MWEDRPESKALFILVWEKEEARGGGVGGLGGGGVKYVLYPLMLVLDGGQIKLKMKINLCTSIK